MSALNFEDGLKKLHTRLHPEVKLTKEAMEQLSGLCNYLNVILIDECKSNFKGMKKKKASHKTNYREINPLHAQNAVKKLFKDKVKDFALSEGQRAVFRYESGLLAFDDIAALQYVEVNVSPQHEFERSLSRLAQFCVPGLKLVPRTKEYVAQISLALMDLLGRSAVGDCRNRNCGEISVVVMARATNDLFMQDMFDHAHAAGMRYILSLAEGLISTPHTRIPIGDGRRRRNLDPEAERMERLFAVAEKWQQDRIYSRAVRQFFAENMHDGPGVRKEVVLKLDGILTYLAPILAAQAVKYVIDNNVNILDMTAMSTSLLGFMPEEMGVNAASFARNISALFQIGEVVFIPKPSREQIDEQKQAKEREKLAKRRRSETRAGSEPKPKKRKPDDSGHEFDLSPSLRNLYFEIHKFGSVDKQACGLVNGLVLKTLRDILSDIRPKTTGPLGRQTLTAQEVLTVIRNIFPGSMKEHALRGGDVALMKACMAPPVDDQDFETGSSLHPDGGSNASQSGQYLRSYPSTFRDSRQEFVNEGSRIVIAQGFLDRSGVPPYTITAESSSSLRVNSQQPMSNGYPIGDNVQSSSSNLPTWSGSTTNVSSSREDSSTGNTPHTTPVNSFIHLETSTPTEEQITELDQKPNGDQDSNVDN